MQCNYQYQHIECLNLFPAKCFDAIQSSNSTHALVHWHRQPKVLVDWDGVEPNWRWRRHGKSFGIEDFASGDPKVELFHLHRLCTSIGLLLESPQTWHFYWHLRSWQQDWALHCSHRTSECVDNHRRQGVGHPD